jgi:hypothetical protein
MPPGSWNFWDPWVDTDTTVADASIASAPLVVTAAAKVAAPP